MDKRKILLLGGTGAMGTHLTSILACEGNDILVTSRRRRESALPNVRYIPGNARDEKFIANLISEKFDVIVDFMVYSTPVFQARHKLFLVLCKHYVYLSSAHVYADSCGRPISENSPRLLDVSDDKEYLKTDDYALSKARQEDILRASGKCNYTIIRPYITYSETRLQLGVLEKEDWLQRALKGGTIVFSKDIAHRKTTLTYGFDVARGIAAIAGREEAFGEAFHITVNESMEWIDVLNAYLDSINEHTGFRPKVLLTEISQNMRIGKYQVIYDRYFDRVFDNSKIGQFIDVNSFTPIKEGVSECVKDFLKSPSFLRISPHMEALRDRTCREFSSMSGFTLGQYIKYLIFRTIYPKNRL